MPRLMSNTEKRSVKVSLTLTPNQAAALEKDARRLGRSVSDVAGLIIAQRLAEQPAAN